MTTEKVETAETAEPSEKGAGEEKEMLSRAEVDALLAKEVELRKQAEAATTKWANEAKKAQASREEWQDKLQDTNQQIRILAGLVAEGRSPEEAETLEPKEKENVLRRFETLTQQQEARRIGDKYRRDVESLGLTEEDDEYIAIYRDVRDGLFKAADKKIARIKEAKEKKEDIPVETEQEKADKFKKAVEEAARKMLEEKGQLVSETGGPSAAKSNFAQIEADYTQGKVSRRVYDEARKREGL